MSLLFLERDLAEIHMINAGVIFQGRRAAALMSPCDVYNRFKRVSLAETLLTD